MKYNRLTFIKEVGRKHKHILWLCICDCGVEKIYYKSNVTRGHTRSCGCLHKAHVAEMGRKYGGMTAQSEARLKACTKHGHCKNIHNKESITHRSWRSMKERCTNPKRKDYVRYGGRGITFITEWNHFENFLRDMGERPSSEYSLDRINVNGNYEPSNCRWITKSENSKRRYDT